VKIVEKVRVLVSWEFFNKLYPFNAEVLNGNAMLIRACGGKRTDGSICRSKEYLLFGQGMATLLFYKRAGHADPKGYVVEVTARRDSRGIVYYELQSVTGGATKFEWLLEVSNVPPPSDEEGYIRRLIEVNGDPGQYFFLSLV